MRIALLCSFFLLQLSSQASAEFLNEASFGFVLGNNFLKEEQAGVAITHDEQFFSLGTSFGYRGTLRLGPIGLGGLGYLDWEGARYSRQSSNESIFASTSYGITNLRYAYGASLAYFIPGTFFRIIGEYLPYVHNKVLWTKEKGENPFKKDDTLTGWGWGAGFAYRYTERISLFVMYRDVNYTKGKITRVDTDIPGTQFKKAGWGGIYLNAAVVF